MSRVRDVSVKAFSIREPALVYCLNGADSVLFVRVGHHRNKTSRSYKSAPGHYDGYVPLCRCVGEFLDELVCE